MARERSSAFTGFTRWTSKPACWVRMRSSALPKAVTAITRASCPQGSVRIKRHMSNPSIPGIPRSRSTTSGAVFLHQPSPSKPLSATTTSKPMRFSSKLNNTAVSRSSSTTSTRLIAMPVCPSSHGIRFVLPLMRIGGPTMRPHVGERRSTPSVWRPPQKCVETTPWSGQVVWLQRLVGFRFRQVPLAP